MQSKAGFILQPEVKLCYTMKSLVREHALNYQIIFLIRSFVLFEELGRL